MLSLYVQPAWMKNIFGVWLLRLVGGTFPTAKELTTSTLASRSQGFSLKAGVWRCHFKCSASIKA
jgi:hypothetical protein